MPRLEHIQKNLRRLSHNQQGRQERRPLIPGRRDLADFVAILPPIVSIFA
jgi:hypothetical protein